MTLCLGLVLHVGAEAQTCPNRTTLADLEATMASTEAAFADLDVALFSSAMEDLSVKLPCVRDAIPATVAARYHRVVGIRLFTDGQELEAFQALQAARILDMSYHFPAGMFPPGHALVVQYNALDSRERTKGRELAPRDLRLFFDGAETRRRPAGRATLLQFATTDGVIRSTQFLQTTAPMPVYESRQRLRQPIAIGTTIAAGLAAALYGGALLSKTAVQNQNPRYDMDDLTRLKQRTNVLVGLSATFASLAVGGGLSIAIVGDR